MDEVDSKKALKYNIQVGGERVCTRRCNKLNCCNLDEPRLPCNQSCNEKRCCVFKKKVTLIDRHRSRLKAPNKRPSSQIGGTWSYIINPKTGRKVNVLGKVGRKILMNYINIAQGTFKGGSSNEYNDTEKKAKPLVKTKYLSKKEKMSKEEKEEEKEEAEIIAGLVVESNKFLTKLLEKRLSLHYYKPINIERVNGLDTSYNRRTYTRSQRIKFLSLVDDYVLVKQRDRYDPAPKNPLQFSVHITFRDVIEHFGRVNRFNWVDPIQHAKFMDLGKIIVNKDNSKWMNQIKDMVHHIRNPHDDGTIFGIMND
jgi:hypothetical protein